MIIAYPKYFVMPVIMEEDFEFNHKESLFRGNLAEEEVPRGNNEDEFKHIDGEYVEEELKN